MINRKLNDTLRIENGVVIPMPLVTLNEYINAERRNRYAAARLKHLSTITCDSFTREAMRRGVCFRWPVILNFAWYMPSRRQDPDNIAFQKKFILDGFQMAGFLDNDSWRNISGFTDSFTVDKRSPRVEITATEVTP